MGTQLPTYEIYRTLMLEIKIRLQRAEFIVQSKLPVNGLHSLDIEFCFLQIRRIIELITFSIALREELRYKKLREINKEKNHRDHGDYTKDWEVADILKRLSEISLHFLPIPIGKIISTADRATEIERSTTSVTHGRLIEIYKQSSGFLHTKNPLGKDFESLIQNERKKYDNGQKDIKKCLLFIRSIIWRHAAIVLEWSDEFNPTELANPDKAWLVDFGSEEDDISIVPAEAK